MKRECGSCTACCTLMWVEELEKPERVPCPHLCAKGCGIYETRPGSCGAFLCLWLWDEQGLLREDDRPDKSGVMLFIRYGTPLSGPEGLMTALPVESGKPLGPQALMAIERVAKIGAVHVDEGTRHALIGPLGELEKLKARMGGAQCPT